MQLTRIKNNRRMEDQTKALDGIMLTEDVRSFLDSIPSRSPRKPAGAKLPPEPKHILDRYRQAHEQDFKLKYPSAYASGHYFAPTIPKTRTANGLQQAIINFLMWNGHRATRIAASGRVIKGKYIPGPTRRGSSDISATIRGRSVMLEIKIGADKPSEYQLREKELEEKAGGLYFFVKTFQEFLQYYDFVMNL